DPDERTSLFFLMSIFEGSAIWSSIHKQRTTRRYLCASSTRSRRSTRRSSAAAWSTAETIVEPLVSALPAIFASVLGTLGWNYWVCRPQSEVAALCYEGRSCYTVFADGVGSAFRDNASLAAVPPPARPRGGAGAP
ncbi:unnamed protein product, partial [Prorocentrum cordatum]